MAEASGVTEASLKTKITDLLQATYVEIEDMSGTGFAPLLPSSLRRSTPHNVSRRLRPGIFCSDSLLSIRKEDYVGTASIG